MRRIHPRAIKGSNWSARTTSPAMSRVKGIVDYLIYIANHFTDQFFTDALKPRVPVTTMACSAAEAATGSCQLQCELVINLIIFL